MTPSTATEPTARTGRRLAEAVAALSIATDLGMGQPMEKALRTSVLAVDLAHAAKLPAADVSDAYYLALLTHLGCTSTAVEYHFMSGGDDTALRSRLATVVTEPVEDVPRLVFQHVSEVAPPEMRDSILGAMMTNPDGGHDLLRGQCEAAVLLAETLPLSRSVVAALGQVYERWDGQGDPQRLSGEEIAPAVRVVQLAHDAEIFCRVSGLEACVGELRRRMAAGAYDPRLTDLLCARAGDLLSSLPVDDAWVAALASEPNPRLIDESELDAVTVAIGRFADLRSPRTLGHSAGVASLAHAAALACGMEAAEAATIRRAGHVHDIGRIGVPVGIWDKPARLTEAEWERVRLHPYYTERVLSRPGVLAPLAGLAAAHHERLDGTGYPKALDASRISAASRLLAAADAYQAMTQARAHRPALAPREASRRLRLEASEGRLDGQAVNAVLEAAGQPPPRARGLGAAGLTEREVAVLRLICSGLANKQVAAQLGLSVKTVGRHLENIYEKAGVSTRAAAAVFAMRHGLV